MISSNGRTTHGDIATLLVLGCDWAGLDLSMCMLLQWLNRPALFVAVAEMALVATVAVQALVATVAEQALFVAVAEMALDA